MTEPADARTAFIKAATWHGPLEPAQPILAAHPALAKSDIHVAAILGDDVEVRRLLALDPAGVTARVPPYELAARGGRGALLALFETREFSVELSSGDRLIAACARNRADLVHAIAQHQPDLVRELLAQGGARIAEFAATWNTAGVGHLLDLGVPVTALYQGDSYRDIAPDSMALHVAAWRGVASTVKLLVARGWPVNAGDGKGRTPLMRGKGHGGFVLDPSPHAGDRTDPAGGRGFPGWRGRILRATPTLTRYLARANLPSRGDAPSARRPNPPEHSLG